MITANFRSLRQAERHYPGILKDLRSIEGRTLPPCPLCHSPQVKQSATGAIGRTITLSALTSKLTINPTGQAQLFCPRCHLNFTRDIAATLTLPH